jgi:AraC family transcriptional regulator of adaptative response/methylated-DNA-[protein]-cysteine methyltransferase
MMREKLPVDFSDAPVIGGRIMSRMQHLPNEDILYQALLERDSRLEGTFYFGVKTTGIFCRPGCSARKPKKENVDYFESIQGALAQGYRPCKICSPLTKTGAVPVWLRALLDEVHQSPESNFKDAELRARNVDPTRIRRWFQKHHSMTFHAYVKALRVNRAYRKMNHNSRVIDTAFDSGYESLSGFHAAFKNVAGVSPSQASSQSLVTITQLATPLGPMYAGATDRGLCFLEFNDRKLIDLQIEQLQQRMKARFVTGKTPILSKLETQLVEYFDVRRRDFELPLDMTGTSFQIQAWQALRKIPYGETRSYQQQALEIGNAKAVRAIASANAKNHITIVIPCHRVIAADGDLAGFGGGVWRKKYLLDLESNN